MNGVGKLKKTLKERCPQCGELLQIRTIQEKGLIKGEEVFFHKEYTVCSFCGFKDGKEDKNKYRK